MKTWLRKTDEAIWESPFSTDAPISEQFFHNPTTCQNFKN